jgi:hypothetical protein
MVRQRQLGEVHQGPVTAGPEAFPLDRYDRHGNEPEQEIRQFTRADVSRFLETTPQRAPPAYPVCLFALRTG